MRVRAFVFLLAIVSALTLAYSASAQDATATAEAVSIPSCPSGAVADDAPVIKIGAAVSATGAYVHEGGDVRNGYTLWQEWVNGEQGGINVGGVCYKAEITYYDDQSDAKMVASLTEKLISEDKVRFILAPYSTGLTKAASEVSEQHGVIMVEGNGASESLFTRGFKNFFGVITMGMEYTSSGIELAGKLGARSAYIAYEDESFSQSVEAGAEKWLAAANITVLGKQSFPSKTTDVKDIIGEAAAANPDLFIAIGHYQHSILFVKEAKAQNFKPDATLMTVGPADPAFVNDLGADANGIWGASQWASSLSYKDDWFGTAADFAARYEKRFGIAPSYQAASATAAALALQFGIETAGSLDTDAVRAAMSALNVDTFYGTIAFDETGKNVVKPMITTQVQDGKAVVIAPEGAAVVQAIWPAP